jgi:hypothetical protein
LGCAGLDFVDVSVGHDDRTRHDKDRHRSSGQNAEPSLPLRAGCALVDAPARVEQQSVATRPIQFYLDWMNGVVDGTVERRWISVNRSQDLGDVDWSALGALTTAVLGQLRT